MIGRVLNPRVLDHITGLLFFFYVKLFLPFFYILVDFWNGMSFGIVLDIKLDEKNFIKELGVFTDKNVQG